MSGRPERTVAISQPAYLPWLGYFDIIDRADTFVFLDSVQFDRRSWQQRNRVRNGAEPLWLTVPVHSKGLREQRIEEVRITRDGGFPAKHLASLRHLYRRAAFFDRYYEPLAAVMERDRTHLVDLNIDLITWLCESLGVPAPVLRSSQLPMRGEREALLEDIAVHVGATRYVSAAGTRAYLEGTDAFVRRGIALVYHEYAHPAYRQQGEGFLPYLSSIDLLFNEGPASLEIIRSGRRTPAEAA